MVEEVLQDVLALSISSSLGGSERSLLEFGRRAAENGIELEVGVPAEGPLSEELRANSVRVREFPVLRPLLHLSQQPGRVDLRAWASAPGNFRRAGRAIVAAAGQRLIYSNSFKTHLAVALAGGPQAVWHLREFPPATTSVVWAPIAAGRARAMIANSHAVASAWQKLVDPLRRETLEVSVVHNGVDTSLFQPGPRNYDLRGRLGLPDSAFVFGMPAALAEWKGHLQVIDAFEIAAEMIPGCYLVIVGGAIYDTVAERNFAKGIEQRMDDACGRIFHIGFEKEIAPVYREFDCTIHYSLRPEPFGRVLIESMASGIPVIASDEGGPREIIPDGPDSGGWLCRPRSPRDLGAAMLRVMRLEAGALRRVGGAGRARATRFFDGRDYASNLASALQAAAPDLTS